MEHLNIKQCRSSSCESKCGADCSDCRTQLISSSYFFNIFSTILKGTVGFLVGSQSLMADALHSLSDTIAFALNYFDDRNQSAGRKATGTYEASPHVSVFMGMSMFVAGFWILFSNASALIIDHPYRPGMLALFVAILSVGVNGITSFKHHQRIGFINASGKRFPSTICGT
ncbi:MAG: cation transporter [SAR324 cluster bacterium]|nr:cation transporter [SAR324 cluster bacterium]